MIQGSGERPFTQLTHGLCFLFIAKSVAKLWLLLLPQVDRPESLSIGINAKYSIAHSHAICLGHGPYIRRSNLANCKFTLVPVLIKQATVNVPQAQKEERESETELVVSSIAQGPAKNAIKIDVLLTDSDNRGS